MKRSLSQLVTPVPAVPGPVHSAPFPSPAPDEWVAQVQAAARTTKQLAELIPLTENERRGAERAEAGGFPISVTPYYLSLIDPHDEWCPIRQQVIPRLEEAQIAETDLRDPLGEEAHAVAPELIQRYPDRALLLVSDRCSVYCRFCTRSRMVGAGGGARSLQRLEPALAYLRAHPEVKDLIVSGGDPLVMATSRIASILRAIRSIPHIETIRIASRVPVTLPHRITAELLDALAPYHPLWVMTHFNHPKELTPLARAACRRLADRGFPVMNQTVLLRGVNDDADTLTRLFRGLVRERVRPYYLLQMDPVVGTQHLRTKVSTGEELMRALQGQLSGIALPKYIVDTPGGFGKVPAGPSFVLSRHDGVTRYQSPRGIPVDYYDPE